MESYGKKVLMVKNVNEEGEMIIYRIVVNNYFVFSYCSFWDTNAVVRMATKKRRVIEKDQITPVKGKPTIVNWREKVTF